MVMVIAWISKFDGHVGAVKELLMLSGGHDTEDDFVDT